MQQLMVGAYTKNGSHGIHMLRFNEANGESSPIGVIEADNPSYFVLTSCGHYLYAVNEIGADKDGRVSAYRLEGEKWTLIDSRSSQGADPCHLLLTPNERYLIVSNYSGGSLAVYRLGADHTLGEPVQVFAFGDGSHVRPEQMGSHVHSTIISPEGDFIFACDLGNDCLYRYHFDELINSDTHAPFDSDSRVKISIRSGAGPRMARFSRDGRFLYVLGELDGSIETFAYHRGELTSLQRISLVDEKRHRDDVTQSGAEIVISHDGRFVYASNRGSQNEIVVFNIDSEHGVLHHLANYASGGEVPRHFTLTEHDDVLVANQQSGTLVWFVRDPETGSLECRGVIARMDQPSYVFSQEV